MGTTLRLAIIALIAGLLAGTAGVTTVWAASPTACRVKDLGSEVVTRSLQAAVDAASPDDRLTVRGTCHGTTRIEKDLRITGIETVVSGTPTLDGDDLGLVVRIDGGVRVTLANLTLRDGKGRNYGGGIRNRRGTLVLHDVVVRGSTAGRGGGVMNEGTLVLDGSTSIRGNAGGYGGGVYNVGWLTMDDSSSVRGNAGGAGGGVHNTGRLTMIGASVIRANTASAYGGGVHNRGTLTMNDAAAIADNAARWTGGGVQNEGALVMHEASSITGNTARDLGGGVYDLLFLVGVICAPAPGANVHDNSPDDCFVDE